jgi:hypothetical protein
MNADKETRPDWLDERFWQRLDRMERHHQRIQSEHETWRRSLDRCRETSNDDLPLIWQRYCEVIAELEQTTAEFEALRASPNGPYLNAGDHEIAFPARLRRP